MMEDALWACPMVQASKEGHRGGEEQLLFLIRRKDRGRMGIEKISRNLLTQTRFKITL
jgi:hypothetical protein